MKRNTPAFWDTPGGLGSLLAPLGSLYALLGRLQVRFHPPSHANVPVISIGNVTLGGAGKTPVAISVSKMLQEAGETPHLLSRGYGAEIRVPIQVDPDLHSAVMVGDEPLLLARAAPTWAYPDRAQSAKKAAAAGASVLVLDDGLQHYSLHRDLSLLVIDTTYHLGNGQIFPAGPLRESLASALAKTDAVIALGESPLRLAIPSHIPIFRAAYVPGPEWAELKGKPVIPFAGLARPEKFFTMCEKQGLAVVERYPFEDHYRYTRRQANILLERAQLMNATLVTTEKDAVKLNPDDRKRMKVLSIQLLWQDEGAFRSFLLSRLADIKRSPAPQQHEG
jgi:tetraacyldisaccharide 4'-kinase